jgi:hypothetical protein
VANRDLLRFEARGRVARRGKRSPRTIRAIARAVGTKVRAVRSASTLVFALLLVACSTARYRGRDDYDAACPVQIENPCVPGPAGGAGCAPDPTSADQLLKGVPPDASYPAGCTVFIPDPTPDEVGQCTINGSCRCARASDGGLGWICQG